MAIKITLGGKPCLDPRVETLGLREHRKPIPPDFGRANCLLNPLGREPARGWLLMLRSDLDLMGLDGLVNLLLYDGTTVITAYNLVVCKEPLCLTPSVTPDDPDASYLVEVADARWRCHNPYYSVSCTKQYNVRAGAYGGAGSGATLYHVDSLNSGTPWTWATMTENLWGLLSTQLGSFPGLPFSPDGTPEGWVWVGASAWEALCDVLDRIGCAVRWDPTAASSAYSIVRVGSDDATASAALTGAARRLIHDADYLPIVRGKEPASVRVHFHRLEKYAGTEETVTRATSAQWQMLAVYTVDVAGGGSTAESGAIHPLWDDAPAVYDETGTITNAAELATRAAERSADYYRMLRTGGERLHKTYSGLVTIAPGSTVKGVAWRMGQSDPLSDGGLVTEVVRHPYQRLRAGDNGQWEECCHSSLQNQSPQFGPTWPLYPETDAVIEIASGTPSGGLYDCTLEKPATATTFTDKDSVWGLDLAGASSLTAGQRYVGRLTFYSASRPVFAFRSAAFTPGAGVGETMNRNGILVGTRPTFNFIEGTGILLTGADNPGTNACDLTIAANTDVTWNMIFRDDVITIKNNTINIGVVGGPTTINHLYGSDVYPSTSSVSVAPNYQLLIPTLTGTTAAPTYTPPANGALLCGPNGLFQYSGGWGAFPVWPTANWPAPSGGIVYVNSSNQITNDATKFYYDPTNKIVNVIDASLTIKYPADAFPGITVYPNDATPTKDYLQFWDPSFSVKYLYYDFNYQFFIRPPDTAVALTIKPQSAPSVDVFQIKKPDDTKVVYIDNSYTLWLRPPDTSIGMVWKPQAAPTVDVFEIFKSDGTLILNLDSNWIWKFGDSASASVRPAVSLKLPVVPSKPTYTLVKGETVTDCKWIYKGTGDGSEPLKFFIPTLNTPVIPTTGNGRVPIYDRTTGGDGPGYRLPDLIRADTTNNRVGINQDPTTAVGLFVRPNVNSDRGITVRGQASQSEPLLRLESSAGAALLEGRQDGELRLYGATSGYVGLKSAATSDSTTYTLPDADGDPDDVLSTDGSGVLSWTPQTGGSGPGGADTDVQYNDGGAFGGDGNLTWDKTNRILTVSGATCIAQLGGSSVAGSFDDGTHDVNISDGTYAVNAKHGSIRTLGTSSNTFRWQNSSTAPSTNSGTPTTRYGGDTKYLGDPDAWILIDVGGTAYKVPAYL